MLKMFINVVATRPILLSRIISTYFHKRSFLCVTVGSRKSSKSVTFTSGVAYEERQELHNVETDPSGMLVETPREADGDKDISDNY